MRSLTKAQVTPEQLQEMLSLADIPYVTQIKELTGGEFNLAYRIYTEKGNLILKIAPPNEAAILTYEQGIMETELWAYDQIQQNTQIPIPKIVYHSKEIIGSHWFLMTEMSGTLYCDAELDLDQDFKWNFQFGQALAELHQIQGAGFGYRQNQLYETWQEAYHEMVYALVEDAEKQGLLWPHAAEIWRFIHRWSYVLDQVKTPCLVHFDLFSNNVFADDDGNFAGLIDTERCFFGDPLTDLFAIDFLAPVEENEGLILGYNEMAQAKIEITLETKARIALGRLYLGLLMFTEGTTRLAANDPAHWQRKALAVEIIQYALNEV